MAAAAIIAGRRGPGLCEFPFALNAFSGEFEPLIGWVRELPFNSTRLRIVRPVTLLAEALQRDCRYHMTGAAQ